MRMTTLLAAMAVAALPTSLAAQATNPQTSQPPSQMTTPTPQPQPNSTPAPSGAEQPATAADLRQGATVTSPTGETLGTIHSVTGSGVMISVGDRVARVPASAIRKSGRGLLMAATRAELEAAAQAAPRSPS